MAEYRLTKIWITKLGWPVTWYRNRPVTNFIRWMLHARGRAWWYRSDEGGCYPCVWEKQPNGAVTPIMDTGRAAAARIGIAGSPDKEARNA